MADLNKLSKEEIDELEELELQKQYEFMQYAEDAANADAEYYGEMQ